MVLSRLASNDLRTSCRGERGGVGGGGGMLRLWRSTAAAAAMPEIAKIGRHLDAGGLDGAPGAQLAAQLAQHGPIHRHVILPGVLGQWDLDLEDAPVGGVCRRARRLLSIRFKGSGGHARGANRTLGRGARWLVGPRAVGAPVWGSANGGPALVRPAVVVWVPATLPLVRTSPLVPQGPLWRRPPIAAWLSVCPRPAALSGATPLQRLVSITAPPFVAAPPPASLLSPFRVRKLP